MHKVSEVLFFIKNHFYLPEIVFLELMYYDIM